MDSIAYAASKVLSGNGMFIKSPYNYQKKIARPIRINKGHDPKKTMITDNRPNFTFMRLHCSLKPAKRLSS